jgi:hypothetical protein
MRQATGGMETKLCNEIHQAQELLSWVAIECGELGLELNASKIEVMTYNI